MDASHARERNHGPVARWLDGTQHGCVAVQRHVRTLLVVAAHIRTADDLISEMASIRWVHPQQPSRRPSPVNKRVWASVEREMTEVIDEGFREALRRDPEQQRTWVVLVEGQAQ